MGSTEADRGEQPGPWLHPAIPRRFNLADLFEIVVDTVPDRLALVAGSVRHTYLELDRRANRFADHLIRAGHRPGSHVGILAYNRAEWAEAMIGCYKARAVPVNLNYRYVAPELLYVIDNADLEVLVYEDGLSELVGGALEARQASRPLQLIVLEDDAAHHPAGDSGVRADDHPATNGGAADDDPGSDALDGAVDFEQVLARADDSRTSGVRSPDDIYILYTGGTTGMPKGVLWRQEDIFFAAMGGGGWGSVPITTPEELAGRIRTDEGDRLAMMVVGPLMHGNAQWVMWNAFMMGATAVLYTGHRYDPDALWRLIGDERVASVGLVGDAMARPLARAFATAPANTYDASSLRVIGSGGAMLSDPVKQELGSVLPNVIVMDRFGSSESGAQGAVERGASGSTFVMSPDTAVLDEHLKPLRPGDGRIGRLARSGRIPLGYYKDSEKTEATFPVDAEGVRWSVPGDLASVQPDGTIVVHGRGSASISSGGEKIFPEEVESAVKSHPAVFDAVVVGLNDDEFGERVAVAVQPKAGTSAPSLAELQDHCRTSLAGYKLPRRLLLVDEIPLTAAGKPDARTARALFETGG